MLYFDYQNNEKIRYVFATFTGVFDFTQPLSAYYYSSKLLMTQKTLPKPSYSDQFKIVFMEKALQRHKDQNLDISD